MWLSGVLNCHFYFIHLKILTQPILKQVKFSCFLLSPCSILQLSFFRATGSDHLHPCSPATALLLSYQESTPELMVFFLIPLNEPLECTVDFEAFVGQSPLKIVCLDALVVCEKSDHQYKTNKLLEFFLKYSSKSLFLHYFHMRVVITYFRD